MRKQCSQYKSNIEVPFTMKQSTHHLLMIRPFCFRMNEETASNNYYQKVLSHLSPQNVQEKALSEFDAFVRELRRVGIRVSVFEDTPSPSTPDSIFPNNWVSFHEGGLLGIYPMFAVNRRHEKRMDIVEDLAREGFTRQRVIDYSYGEREGKFLEGTGSMVLDRENRKAYAALSPRTDAGLLEEFCKDFGFTAVSFSAYQTVGEDVKRLPIYHTNVMMSVGEDFAVICLGSIDHYKEKKNVVNTLKADGKKIIEIDEYQVGRFAGNMLQVRNVRGEKFLVMSSAARQALKPAQVSAIEEHCQIISSSLDTIEACGGGSARCMMAEVFHS